MVGFARFRGTRPALPPPLVHAPGPWLLIGAQYTDSPVGPYLELAIGAPARLGMRPGWCITTMIVDSPASRVGGRLNWGYPKELGTLLWDRDGDAVELRWVERGLALRGVPRRLGVPAIVPLRTLQHRSDGPVVVPSTIRGRARYARVELEVPADDPLAGLAGPHPGVGVQGMRFVVRPARSPVGLTATLRAPLRAPQVAVP